jgi:hypothetical protein
MTKLGAAFKDEACEFSEIFLSDEKRQAKLTQPVFRVFLLAKTCSDPARGSILTRACFWLILVGKA